MNEENNEERDKPIQFYVSEREKEDIEEYRKIANTTKSEFIRQAIFDKIMRMKSPEVFKSGMNGVSKNRIRELLETTTKNTKKIDLLMEKMDLVLDTKKYIEILSKRVNRDSIKDILEQLEPLFTSKKAWKIQELVNELEHGEDDILKALTQGNYSIDMNGRVKKNE